MSAGVCREAALGQSSSSNERRPGLCAGAVRRRLLIEYSDAHIQAILTPSLLVKSQLGACVLGGLMEHSGGCSS